MPSATPAHVVSHPATQTTTVHLPSLPNVADVNTSDPRVQQGALYGAGAVAVAGAAAYGLYALYRYYAVRSAGYKLSYFNGRALGETSRYLFALAGVEYEDFRYPPATNGVQSPAFEAVKDSLPYGQLPTLQVGGPNGVVLAQSKAIERYLASEFGLFGSSSVERQLIDSVGEAVYDLRNAYFKARDQPDEKAKFFGNTLVTTLRYIERLANQHCTAPGKDVLVGASISLADAQLYHFLSIFDDQQLVSRAVDNFPIVRASRQHFGQHPSVARWIAARPATPW